MQRPLSGFHSCRSAVGRRPSSWRIYVPRIATSSLVIGLSTIFRGADDGEAGEPKEGAGAFEPHRNPAVFDKRLLRHLFGGVDVAVRRRRDAAASGADGEHPGAV